MPSMDDQVFTRIKQLTDEEHELEAVKGDELSAEKLERLEQVRVALDQCWDLLRQRRARREFGLDPDNAGVRPPDVVERYQQ